MVDNQISRILKYFLISIPVLLGTLIIFLIEALYWVSTADQPIKGGKTTILCSFIGQSFHLIPFIVIAVIISKLIAQQKRKNEIYIKLAAMLGPVSILTTYWLYTYLDPLAQGFLLGINIGIVLIVDSIGAVATKAS